MGNFTKKSLLLLMTAIGAVSANAEINNILTGDSYNFEGGTRGEWSSWGNESSSEASASGYNSSAYCLHLNNPSTGNDYYVAQAGCQLSTALTNGTTYTLRFKAKSANAGGTIQFCYQQNGGNYDGGGYTSFDLTTEWAIYEKEITVSKDNMDRIVFSFGKVAGDFYIDDIEFGIDEDVTPPASNINNILSGDSYNFEGGTRGEWSSWGNESSSGASDPGYNSSAYCLHLNNPSAGDDYYVAQAGCQLSTALTNGTTYTLRFKAKSANAGGTIQFCYQQNGGNYDGGGYTSFDLTTEWATYEKEITVSKDNMDRIVFSFGKVAGDFYIDEIEFWDTTPTGIETIGISKQVNSDNIYDLTGRRVSKDSMRHGIYIVNGKKYSVK